MRWHRYWAPACVGALALAAPALARKTLPAMEVPPAEQGLVDDINGYTLDEHGTVARFTAC